MRIVAEQGFRSVAFPLIGAGSGGGNPDQIEEIMKSEFDPLLFDGEVLIVRLKRIHS
jgi:O-acetyl-ADP-ribose deacetylase (regulator of RNase III)